MWLRDYPFRTSAFCRVGGIEKWQNSVHLVVQCPQPISLDVPNNPVVFAFNVGDWYDIVVYKYNVGTTHHLMTFFQLAPLVQNMQPLVQGQ